jgi:hypothetical protein
MVFDSYFSFLLESGFELAFFVPTKKKIKTIVIASSIKIIIKGFPYDSVFYFLRWKLVPWICSYSNSSIF